MTCISLCRCEEIKTRTRVGTEKKDVTHCCPWMLSNMRHLSNDRCWNQFGGNCWSKGYYFETGKEQLVLRIVALEFQEYSMFFAIGILFLKCLHYHTYDNF